MNIKSVLQLSGTTIISRIFGFIRDVLIATYLGTDSAADAFFLAFRLPNIFRSIFAEGAFNSAFIPLFTKKLIQKNNKDATEFAKQALSMLCISIIPIVLIFEIAMPWILPVLAPGFRDVSTKMNMAIFFARLSFPYLIFISLASLCAAVLNGLGHFFMSGFAPVLLNIFLIGAVLLFTHASNSADIGIALSVAISIAGIAQLLFLFFGCMRSGILLLPGKNPFSPSVKRLIILGVPGILSAIVTQINLLIGTTIASLQSGGVSYLYYADRICQLPLGIVGVAISVVLLPSLAKKFSNYDTEGAISIQKSALEFAAFCTMPAMMGIMFLSRDIISVLFQHGLFTNTDVIETSKALIIYALGLPAFILIKIFTPAFFARENTLTPLFFSIISVVCNVCISLLLFHWFFFLGVAAGTTVASWVNAILLIVTLIRNGHFSLDSILCKKILAIFVCAICIGFFSFLSLKSMHFILDSWYITKYINAIILIISIGLSFIFYIFICNVFNIFSIKKFRNQLTLHN